MAPHDLWDLNPVYQLDFWASYSDLLELIGFQEDPENEGLMVYDLQVEGDHELEEVVVIEDVLEADENLNWEDFNQ